MSYQVWRGQEQAPPRCSLGDALGIQLRLTLGLCYLLNLIARYLGYPLPYPLLCILHRPS